MDDVDRTDFSDPALQEDPIAKGPQGPHSEVEPASILPDITDGSALFSPPPLPFPCLPTYPCRPSALHPAWPDPISEPTLRLQLLCALRCTRSSPCALLPRTEVPIGVQSLVLASLANAGRKMFNVSKIMGSLQDGDGKEIQKLPTRVYGEPLGPLEQRSFLFGFTPDEKTPTGQYKLSLQILYNNRDKDQFNDTVFDEAIELVCAQPAALRAASPAVSLVTPCGNAL